MAITCPAVSGATERGMGASLSSPRVRSCSRVVGDVLVQHAAKAGSRQRDDVIEALAPDRSDESFDVGVLPWGARRRQDFLNADGKATLRVITCALLGLEVRLFRERIAQPVCAVTMFAVTGTTALFTILVIARICQRNSRMRKAPDL
jgi:hypothetical protein